jgi:hypothetical protein
MGVDERRWLLNKRLGFHQAEVIRMILYHSKKSESLGYGEEGSVGWEQAAGSPQQSQLEELGEALHEVKAEIQHYSHQRTGS